MLLLLLLQSYGAPAAADVMLTLLSSVIDASASHPSVVTCPFANLLHNTLFLQRPRQLCQEPVGCENAVAAEGALNSFTRNLTNRYKNEFDKVC